MLYTVGYEGRDADDVLELLVQHGVEEVVDVRLNPASRKPGFSRRRLTEALEDVGLTYVHMPELGNPRENRAAFHAGEPAAIEFYLSRLDEAGDTVARIAEAAQARTVALLCYERDVEICHRRQVAEAVRDAAPAVEVKHLP